MWCPVLVLEAHHPACFSGFPALQEFCRRETLMGQVWAAPPKKNKSFLQIKICPCFSVSQSRWQLRFLDSFFGSVNIQLQRWLNFQETKQQVRLAQCWGTWLTFNKIKWCNKLWKGCSTLLNQQAGCLFYNALGFLGLHLIFTPFFYFFISVREALTHWGFNQKDFQFKSMFGWLIRSSALQRQRLVSARMSGRGSSLPGEGEAGAAGAEELQSDKYPPEVENCSQQETLTSWNPHPR